MLPRAEFRRDGIKKSLELCTHRPKAFGRAGVSAQCDRRPVISLSS